MNEIICENCRYFRKAIHPSQQLVQIVNTSDGITDATIAEALNRIEEDESRVEDAEIKVIENRDEAGRVDWDKRPLMHDYCSLKEGEGRYLIAELVRESDLCNYEEPPLQGENSCASCIHRSQPAGPIQDAENMNLIMKAFDFAHLMGNPDQPFNSGAANSWIQKNDEYMNGIRKRQATEITRAYKEVGSMRIEPQYIPYCKKYSDPKSRKYVLCLWQNPYDTCEGWQSTLGSEIASGIQESNPSSQGLAGQYQAAPPQAETVVFTSSFDDKHCGGYGFTLNSPRLVVSEPAGPQHLSGGPQNHYDLTKLSTNQWVALKNFRGEQLPVYIHWNGVILQARVGTAPQGPVSVLPVKDYSLEWRFEPQANGLYKHPEGGLSLRFRQEYPWTPWYIEVTTPFGETINFPLKNLLNRQWLDLYHPNGSKLPLRAWHDGTRVIAEWLPLESLKQ